MAALMLVGPHHELMKRIGDAIGVTFPWNRLVIECDVRDIVRVYVTAPAEADKFRNVCEAFEAVGVQAAHVNPDHSVCVIPFAEKAE